MDKMCLTSVSQSGTDIFSQYDIWWIINLILIFIIAVILSAFKFYYKRKGEKINNFFWDNWLYGLIFAGTFLLLVPFYRINGFEEDEYNLLESVGLSLQHSIRVFFFDGDLTKVIGGLDTGYDVLNYIYKILIIFVFIGAPFRTIVTVLSFFENFFGKLRVQYSWKKHLYVFSELNEKSIALAKSIYRKSKMGQANRSARHILIVFTDVLKKNTEAHKDLMIQAKEFGAVCIDEDLEALAFRKNGKRNIEFFLISEDEAEKIRHAKHLCEKYDFSTKVKVFLFSSSVQSKLFVSMTNPEHLKLNRIDDIQALIYHQLDQNGMRLFETAKMLHKNKKKKAPIKITAVIVGFGRYGTEMFKSLLWFCQIPGYTLDIYVIDSDKNTDDRIHDSFPGLNVYDLRKITYEKYDSAEQVREQFGNVSYRIFVHGDGIDVNSHRFTEYLSKIPDPTYVFVCLGDDGVNIEKAKKIREIYEAQGKRPDIETVVYNSRLAEMMSCVWHTPCAMEAAYRLIIDSVKLNTDQTSFEENNEIYSNAEDDYRALIDRANIGKCLEEIKLPNPYDPQKTYLAIQYEICVSDLYNYQKLCDIYDFEEKEKKASSVKGTIPKEENEKIKEKRRENKRAQYAEAVISTKHDFLTPEEVQGKFADIKPEEKFYIESKERTENGKRIVSVSILIGLSQGKPMFSVSELYKAMKAQKEEAIEKQYEDELGALNFSDDAYNIHMIGDLSSFYSYDTIIDNGLEKRGREVNERYDRLGDELKAKLTVFESIAKEDKTAQQQDATSITIPMYTCTDSEGKKPEEKERILLTVILDEVSGKQKLKLDCLEKSKSGKDKAITLTEDERVSIVRSIFVHFRDELYHLKQLDKETVKDFNKSFRVKYDPVEAKTLSEMMDVYEKFIIAYLDLRYRVYGKQNGEMYIRVFGVHDHATENRYFAYLGKMATKPKPKEKNSSKASQFDLHEYSYRSSITKAIHESLRLKMYQSGLLTYALSKIIVCKKPDGSAKKARVLIYAFSMTKEEITKQIEKGVQIVAHEESRPRKQAMAICLIEHVRWNAYMMTEGYVWKPKRNHLAKHHPNLVSVDNLTSDEIQKDL